MYLRLKRTEAFSGVVEEELVAEDARLVQSQWMSTVSSQNH